MEHYEEVIKSGKIVDKLWENRKLILSEIIKKGNDNWTSCHLGAKIEAF